MVAKMGYPLLFTVDVGNTRTKIGGWTSWDGVAPTYEHVENFDNYDSTVKWLSDLPVEDDQTARWIVSSVNSHKTDVLKRTIRNLRPNDVVKLVTLNDIPLNVRYDYPEKLGLDRAVAAFAGLNLLGFGRPFLVVDVGTAATIDYVDSEGVFRGGAILPGPRLTAEALQGKTASLPMLDDPENTNLSLRTNNCGSEILAYPATETHNAIRLGVVFTLVGAITAFYWQTRRAIARENGDPSQLALLLAGGDGLLTKTNLLDYFDDMESALDYKVPRPEIIVESKLVLLGLKAIEFGKSARRNVFLR
jgi:type III pantothenate kinase